jgi:hypothetical protein
VADIGLTVGTSSKTDIRTHSAGISLSSNTIRFGHPVTVILDDPDLNIKHDTIDIYSVIDNPASSDVDTVGDTSGGILLEVLIKDIRYKRCTINGVETPGLAGSGFSLVETGPNTGRFEGVFKMPSQICNKDGTKLVSPAGGTIDLKYHDFRDSSGQPNIYSLSKQHTSSKSSTTGTDTKTTTSSKQTISNKITAKISSKTFTVPDTGKTKDITITGKIPNYKYGTKIKFTLTDPDGKKSTFYALATKQGTYKGVFTIKSKSLPGNYFVDIVYQKYDPAKISFTVDPKPGKKTK